jgi:carboxypeptidase T
MRHAFAVGLGLLLPVSPAFSENSRAAVEQIEVVRVHTRDEALIRRIGSLHTHVIVDRAKGVIVFEADPMDRALLKSGGLRWEVDVEATRAVNMPQQRLPGQSKGIPGFVCYRTVAETRARLDELVSLYPGFASVIDIGDSWEKTAAQPGGGEDLRVLRLANVAIGGDKPKLFIMSSVHAREYTPAELGLRFAEWLLGNYGVDADATWLLDHQELHLLANANPDGRKRAEGGLSWRKNTNTAYCGATSNSRGADLNRNWPFKWAAVPNDGGSSPAPCSLTYRGPAAGSEPETQATVAYMRSIFPDRRGPQDSDPADIDTQGLFFDIHSYSQLVLWPWGWTTPGPGTADQAPNVVPLEALGRRFAWFSGYTPQQANDLYPTDGTTEDAAYGELGVPAYTFELGTAFFQDCALFEDRILPDNLRTLIFAARNARAPYRSAAGPDPREILAAPDLAIRGETVSLRAVIDDTRFSNSAGGTQAAQSVVAANAWVGRPPWAAGASAIPMAPTDGSWNQPSEAVSVSIDTSSLDSGRHLAFVQGTDAGGNDGPIAAGFVQVYGADQIGSVRGVARSAATGAAIAGVQISAGSLRTSSAADGSYTRRLPVGSYTLHAQAAGFEALSVADLAITAAATLDRDLQLYALCRRLDNDAESGTAGWTASAPWAITTAATTQTGSRAWTESPAGNYLANANTSLTSPVFDLSNYSAPQLSFDSWCDTESGWDFGNIEYSANGGSTWSTPAWRCSGDASLRRVTLALPALANLAQARLRFRFTSDSNTQRDGWYVDNIVLEAGGPACRATQAAVPLFADGFEP